MSHRTFYLLLGLILLFAAATRLMVIQHHQPDIVVEDEGSDLSTALRLTQGELPQSHVRYHRSFIAYQHLIASGMLVGAKWFTGEVRSIGEVVDQYFAHRDQFVLAARLWVGFLSVLGIGFVGLAGRYFSPSIGLWAALVLSLNGFLTANGAYALPDTLIIFAAGLTLWAFMRLWQYQRTRDYVLVSVALAVVMLSKLVATPIAIGVLVLHGFIVWQRKPSLKAFPLAFLRDKNLWIAGFVGILANVLLNPIAFIIPQDFLYEISRIAGFTKNPPLHIFLLRLGEELVKFLQLWLFALPFVLIGLGLTIRRCRDARYAMLLACVLVLFFMTWRVMVTMSGPNPQIYYWFALMVCLSLLIGIALEALWQWGGQASRARLIARALVLLGLGLNGWELAQFIRVIQTPLTQHQARDFIQATFTPDTRMMVADPQTYGVPLQRDEVSIARFYELRGMILNSWTWWLEQPVATRPTGYALYGWEVFEVIDTWEDLRAYIEQEEIEYFVVAQYCQNFLFTPNATSSLDFPPHNEALLAEWELVAMFTPYASGKCDAPIATRTGLPSFPALLWAERAGPIIKIYRISR